MVTMAKDSSGMSRTMGTLKAWVVRELGGPEVLTLEPTAPPNRAQGLVRIAVEAAAVNFFDSLQIAGSYQVKPELPFVPGTEVAGTVVAAPAGSGFSPGDRVLARLRQQGLLEGGYSELVEALPEYTVRLPDEMPFDQAAGFFVNYQTGWVGLMRRGRLPRRGGVLVRARADTGRRSGDRLSDRRLRRRGQGVHRRPRRRRGVRPRRWRRLRPVDQVHRLRGPDRGRRIHIRTDPGGSRQPRADQELRGRGPSLGPLSEDGASPHRRRHPTALRPLPAGQDSSPHLEALSARRCANGHLRGERTPLHRQGGPCHGCHRFGALAAELTWPPPLVGCRSAGAGGQVGVAVPQFPLQDLAARILRQGVDHYQVLRDLVACQPSAGMGDQLRGFDAGAWLYDHGGGDSLDPVGMGDAEDCHLGDRRVGEDGLLDLPAGDVLAAGLDHVLLPVHHRQVSIRVDHAKIPR